MIGVGSYNTISTALQTSRTMMASEPVAENGKSQRGEKGFGDYLLNALDSLNNKQISSDSIAQQLIVDPESVDVHDVTIAMAEANLSLSLAQTVIDRLIKGWNDITTTR